MEKRLSNNKRFIIVIVTGLVALIATSLLTIMLGSQNYSINKVFQAFFSYDKDVDSSYFIINARLPRLIADFIVGASLSVAGAIMQGTTKNPMADSGIMGISSGSTLGIVIIIAFFPAAGRFEKMGISALGAFVVTALIYIIAFVGKGRITPDRMVLSGMAISTLLSAITSAIIMQQGLFNQMVRYTSGSSANTIWKDVFIAAPIFLIGIIISILISKSLTIMNLGDDVSKGLGANVILTKTLSTIVVLILSAVAVIIIGPVGYIGLMIPYIARFLVGTDYRYVIPSCAIIGANFVAIVDLVAKIIHPGLEFPIGILITIIGVPFFIYVSRKQEGDQFHE
mgnify:CR=1 FL=1